MATEHSRKYNRAHKNLRARWAKLVVQGIVPCARCGKLIGPAAPWDLGHSDLNPSQHVGPEHRACNRATAAHRRRPQGPPDNLKPTRFSRDW